MIVAVEAKDPGDRVIMSVYHKSILPEPGASVHLGLSLLTYTHFALPLDLKRCLKYASAVSLLAVLNIRKIKRTRANNMEITSTVKRATRQMQCDLQGDSFFIAKTRCVQKMLSVFCKDLCSLFQNAEDDMNQ